MQLDFRYLGLGRPTVLVLAAATLQACDNGPTGAGGSGFDTDMCSIPRDEIFSGAFKDAIPALTDPQTAGADSELASLWRDEDRVVGLVLDGQPIAVPLNILWWHEIVNLNDDGQQVAVTPCPLTGSSLTFGRAGLGIDEFGVSGLLFRNNLVMYDRDSDVASLWPQMSRGARCGPRTGTDFAPVSSMEITWAGWKELYPNTLVVTPNTGHVRDYTTPGNPYRIYQLLDNGELLFPLSEPTDRRRPPKERGLGVPDGSGVIVFPFGVLEDVGSTVAVHETADGEDFVVFWDTEQEGAMAYRPFMDGQDLTFSGAGGRIQDAETGSEWAVDGSATSGPLAGKTLEPVADAFVAFWFAWQPFFSGLEMWEP